MMWLVGLTVGLLVAVGPARGEQYWIAYEGNDFPENEGWVRSTIATPPERWLEDGSLFIDSRADPHTTDNYTIYFDAGLDPEPGETFIMRWRLNVHEATPWDDPGVYVISDDHYAVMFVFAERYVLSTHEGNVFAYFEPGMFHEFELRSGDMRSYELYIDGDLAIEGVFSESFFSACAGWGDVVAGSASLAQWDYFRFGVVPEPAGAAMALAAIVALSLAYRRTAE